MDNDDRGPEATFMDLLAAGRLALPRCGTCGRHHFPPRIACPHCGSTRIAFSDVSGDGVVYSTTTVRNRPERGGDHNVVLIDLDEGARMMATVIECPLEEVRIGMRVRIDRARLVQGDVAFLPAHDGSGASERQ